MVLQSSIIDLQAMAMALAACWVAPLHHMTQHNPPATACTFSGFTLLVAMAAGLLLSQALQMVLLFTWPGFTGGTGTAHLVSLSCSLGPCYMHHHPSLCMLATWTCESCTCKVTKHAYRQLRFTGLDDVQLQVDIMLHDSMTVSMA